MITTRWLAREVRWIELAAVATAALAAATPTTPSASCDRKTRRALRRAGAVSIGAGKALQLPPAFGVDVGHLPGEVSERNLAVLLDQLVHAGLRSEISVLRPQVDRPVDVGLALAPAGQQPFAVKPTHDRHVSGVRARALGPPVERVHRLADRDLVLIRVPHCVHHLC